MMRLPAAIDLFPGAARRETLRRGPGIIAHSEFGMVPAQQRIAKARCAASGTRGF